MYCKNCGKQIDDNADICIHCGVLTDKGNSIKNQQNNSVSDGPDIGLNILAFLIPIIGIIYYAVNREKYPLKADSCGKWALGGFLLGLVLGGIMALALSL